jgi:hypothetical protein
MKRTRIAAAVTVALGIHPAQAVQLNPDGLGQALIFPYYTVRTAPGGNAFNTYLTVVNTTADAKAVRVRFREGRAARPVLDMNLFLSPNDVWAAAMVPTAAGTQLITNDTSCTDPAFVASGSGTPALPLHANAYTGSGADGFGDTLDRTREGFLEVIEMAVLTESSARAVTHNASGVPENCAAIRATAGPTVAAPSAGLSGTLTLINVNSGQDFTLDATALDGLSTRAFFRPPGDPYPDFNALEIDPVSVVLAHGHAYRSLWTRPADAVSAALMTGQTMAEYVLDNNTSSATDLVATLPTRHFHANTTSASPPFAMPVAWGAVGCGSTNGGSAFGEALTVTNFNREEQGVVVMESGSLSQPITTRQCAAASVASLYNSAIHLPPSDRSRTFVFGSTTRSLGSGGFINMHTGFQNGWLVMAPGVRPGTGSQASPLPAFISLTGSTRTNLLTGQVTTGSHTYVGLPVVGFFARTFANGTLTCSAGACQGNYGGAFAYRAREAIQAP